MSTLAKRLIQENIEKHQRGEDATYLDLGNCGLTHLPEEIKELVWLETLILSGFRQIWSQGVQSIYWESSPNIAKPNAIKSLEGIQCLKKLKTLQLYFSPGFIGKINQIPDLNPLLSLINLEELYCSYTNIKDLITISKLSNLKYLDLSGSQELKSLAHIEKLKKLERLNIYETSVLELTPLAQLDSLEQLDCSFTNIRHLKSLEELYNLRELCFSNTLVNDLMPIARLDNITYLDFSSTHVTDLGPLKSLKKLKYLNFSDTQVNNLSPIDKINNLQELFIALTQVTDLSPLKSIINLVRLDAFNISVRDINCLKYHHNLIDLRCSWTLVSDLSPIIEQLKNGIEVSFNGNTFNDGFDFLGCPLTNPPYEVAEKGTNAILDYFEQIEKQGGVQTINEAKLIIVGEGKTGKTTLYNKLIDPAYDLHANPTDETHGINTYEGLEIKEGFRVNLWDFGGQDLQYMTHQFFLSPRALYVLVMDARTESPNLPYWFRIISLLGKERTDEKVSIILVINRQKGGTGRPQFEDLLRLYENDFDVEFMEVDLAVNDARWEALRASIIRRLEELPIVKNPLPKQWNPIREALRQEGDQKPHIQLDRLHEICAEYGVDEEKDQLQMTGYLHQLGSILHFQNDDLLIDTVILQTKWAVEGVYTTLKNEDILRRNGRFTKDDLFHILRGKGYKTQDCTKVLRLMSKNNFDICYESKSSKHFVATQWLPDDRPKPFIWHKDAGALQFRYQYPVMPKGLMSRLIVRLSDYIEVMDGCEMVWKKGAVLRMEDDKCRVYLFEDEDSKSGLKQITIEVMEETAPFENRKYALKKVRDEVEDLHKRWFRNLKFEQIIPCNCQKCNFSTEPFTFLLSELQKLKKPHAYCNKLEDTVPIRQLLEGVYQKEEIKELSPEHDPMRRMRDFERGPEIHVHVENKPVIQVNNQVQNNFQQDLAEVKKMLEQLEETT